MQIDSDKLMGFVSKAVDEVGATLNAALVVMGDKLGYYRALADARPDHAGRTGRADRHQRALRPRVAERPGGGRLRRVRPGDRPLHAAAGAGRRADRPEQPGVPARLLPDRARHGARTPTQTIEAARSGAGIGWHEHTSDVHVGLRAVLPARRTTRTCWPAGCPRSTAWWQKLERGATVADIGCGHGASTILMAAGVPAVDLRRLGLPPGVDRDRPAAGGRGRRRPTGSASRSRRPRLQRVRATTW